MGLQNTTELRCDDGIPVTIVRLNRTILVLGILLGFALQQPLLTTGLFLLLLPAVIWGRRASLIFRLGEMVLRPRATDLREQWQLQRFNNLIATTLLGLAQVAFLFGATIVGWALAGMVAVAASVALAGFCVGCFLYFHFRLQRTRLFGAASN